MNSSRNCRIKFPTQEHYVCCTRSGSAAAAAAFDNQQQVEVEPESLRLLKGVEVVVLKRSQCLEFVEKKTPSSAQWRSTAPAPPTFRSKASVSKSLLFQPLKRELNCRTEYFFVLLTEVFFFVLMWCCCAAPTQKLQILLPSVSPLSVSAPCSASRCI